MDKGASKMDKGASKKKYMSTGFDSWTIQKLFPLVLYCNEMGKIMRTRPGFKPKSHASLVRCYFN